MLTRLTDTDKAGPFIMFIDKSKDVQIIHLGAGIGKYNDE